MGEGLGLAHLAHVLEVDVTDADEPTQPEAAQRAAEVVRDQRGRDVREAVAAAEEQLHQSPAPMHDGLARVGVRARLRLSARVRAGVEVGFGSHARRPARRGR